MKQEQEQGITIFFPGNKHRYFRIGRKNKDYLVDGNVELITAYGDSIDIVFESGRRLSMYGIPYIHNSYQPPSEVPF
jgi:hypothetical protein